MYELWSTFARTCTTSPSVIDSGRRIRGLPRRSRVRSAGPAHPPSATLNLLGGDEAPVVRALSGDLQESARARAHLKRDGRLPVGRREQELAPCRDRVVVQPDLEGSDEVVGFHRVVHRDLARHGPWVLGQCGASIVGRWLRSSAGCARNRRGANSVRTPASRHTRRERFITTHSLPLSANKAYHRQASDALSAGAGRQLGRLRQGIGRHVHGIEKDLAHGDHLGCHSCFGTSGIHCSPLVVGSVDCKGRD